MKRFALALPLLLLAAIGPIFGQPEKKVLSFPSDLFPLKVGNLWKYQGMDPKEKIFVAVDRMEPIRRSITTPAGGERTETFESFILRTTNGDKSLQEQVMVTDDGIYRYAAAGKEIKPPIKILKLPAAKGDAWSVDSKSENVTMKGEFVVEQTTVNLPGKGDVPAWLSKTRDFTVGDQPMETSYWFVPGEGIAKQHVKIGAKFEFGITLEEFRPAAGAIAPPPNGLPNLPKLPPGLDIK